MQKFLGTTVDCKVAALNLTALDTYKYPPEVEWEIVQNNKKDYIDFAETVNADDSISGIILQHEYGIFGDNIGEKVISFMKRCSKPMVVTLHTVLPHPLPKMKSVTEKIIHHATTLVVLTQNSKKIIEEVYPESIGKVSVIPHGIHHTTFSLPEKFKKKLELENHTILTTFGLLNPGKGIEYVINALPQVLKKYPTLKYLVLGETHPVVRRRDGEKYRIKLSQLVKKLRLEKHVKFYDQYLSLDDLIEFLKATDIYISTSTNPNQAVSGTLSYALGTGRAVISTEFAQAKEIVTPEIGRLIPIKNSPALTTVLLDMLSDGKKLTEMSRAAFKHTRYMLWSNVAEEYIKLITQTIIPPFKIDHLTRMTDDFGLFQFGKLAVPNKDFGYTLDDNARALILCSWLIKKEQTEDLENLIRIYFTFIKSCQQSDGSFINYLGYDKKPTDQNNHENLEDANSRALWALAEIMSNSILSSEIKEAAKDMFLYTFTNGTKPTFLRSKAFTIKAYALAAEHMPKERSQLLALIKEYADSLVLALQNKSKKDWYWFEGGLHYNNGLLPESLFIAGTATGNTVYTDKAIQSLQFLIKKTFTSKMYRPIGHSHWYKHRQKRSTHDQQPEDPASMILALVSAYKTTHNEAYKNLARTCFSWFLGNNTLSKPLYDSLTGGCFDGLHPDRVNLNQGAESLVSYLMSSYLLTELT